VKPVRPVEHIRRDLETAVTYQKRYELRPTDNPLVLRMREANEHEIRDLEAELRQATSGELEVTLTGSAYDQHRVGLPSVTRLLTTLQSSFRAVYRSRVPSGTVRREEATLSLVATTPGSFKISVATPQAQLELLEAPLADQVIDEIVELLAAAEQGRTNEVVPGWAAHQDEPVIKSLIRLSAAFAGVQGVAAIRWRGMDSPEQIVTLRAAAARDLVLALAGQPGREVLVVRGHLEMGQDQPPRIRLKSSDDEYLARVPPELLDRVKELLFSEVEATLVVDMRTSPSTGSPDTEIELLDLNAL
jgi:hypothetical protein